MSNENTQIAIYDGVEIEQAVYMAAFAQENGLQNIIDQISTQAQAKAAEIPSDMSVAKNRKALASLARNVASAKVEIDNTGKSLVEDAKAKIKVVDNNRKNVRDTLDDLRDAIRQPVTDWEEAEKAKEQAILLEIEFAKSQSVYVENGESLHSEVLKTRLRMIQVMQEHEDERVNKARQEAINLLKQHIQAAEQHEAQQAEIARLQAEAAEKAKHEAEAKAQAERELMERAKIEAQLKAEAAEREKQAMLERMEAEKQAAAEAERQRLAAEQRAKEEAEAKRAADENHKRQINREIYAVMLDCGIPEQAAQAFLLKLQNGEVPHLKVCY
ncbi:hypothetical protein [Wielerella bovis]|uniref:hypothetical protein n=1 Tax=Wielerella bovis TaxID=2917790 RepID=UPI0020187FE9|nr:hypothetical protein [Wielerella bovis]ULJ66631.1 hypothetical protein MIS31_10340 [Wielerella bovis]